MGKGYFIFITSFKYEEEIKIKYKQVAGISRTYYQPISVETISRSPQSRKTIPLITTIT
jgi:hypothetical protein